MASRSWNSPFKMSKAERDHLNAKREKKDVESRLSQLEFDINVIKNMVLKLAGETDKDPLEYLNEVAKQTSCNNIFKHHTDMIANVVRKVNATLSRKDMVDIEISVSGTDDKGSIIPETLHDKFTLRKVSDKGDYFFAVNINYSTNDEYSYMCADVYNVIDVESENKFSIELFGQDARDGILKDQWMFELERILTFSQAELGRLHFYLYIRKTDSKYTVYGNAHVYDQDDKFITSINIPIKTISNTLVIMWKKENILKKYVELSDK